ncbi:Phosphatidylglycerol/phosphatidylinositol transfer protein [Sphagnurus paluster]|uniref:Phosphatidylglycerol/phosphatidylinositol transfer protein n=1 Tax=Sphagnurus paluster TaxID=117069 RepID=A0A9P7GQ22_9AGAR|nr:Phosphatidylglycerol/phosphatidylinositol transfer protein [Sphagnurus paluster]
MVHFNLFALLALSSAAISIANPVAQQVAMQSGDAPHTTDKWSYINCGLDTDSIQIKSIEVSPDPPQPGKDLTVKVTGTAIQTIEEGAYADVTVKLGLIKLINKRFDVCEEARNANASVQCPVEKGEYVVEHTVALPREIPRGPSF